MSTGHVFLVKCINSKTAYSFYPSYLTLLGGCLLRQQPKNNHAVVKRDPLITYSSTVR